MKVPLIAFFIISGITSCKKENFVFDFSRFKNRYLVCDSLRILNEGVDKTIILGRGTGYDAKFSDTYTIYSNPVKTFSYSDPANIRFSEYKDQQYAKIYFYTPGTDFHLGDYLIIEAEANEHLILLHKDVRTKEQIRYYYTAD